MALPGLLRGREARPAPATPRGGSLSSAILYVAIVAIWACVLIPRWLRRDSSPAAPVAEEQAGEEQAGEEQAGEEQAGEDLRAEAAAEQESAPPARRPRRRDDREDAAGERRPRPAPAPAERRDLPRDAAHRRVLASRRRLLGMLIVLTMGAGALAGVRLAAWWVVLPPSVMLLGYLILLREAGQADAERRDQAREPAVRAVRAVSASGAPVRAAAGPVRPRRAEIIDISASRGPAVRAGEEPYDQVEDARLRAVGD
jgi:hypothetical protein